MFDWGWWPTFNLAEVLITPGVAAVMLVAPRPRRNDLSSRPGSELGPQSASWWESTEAGHGGVVDLAAPHRDAS
jgi:uncharacterized protein (DUF2237 family)